MKTLSALLVAQVLLTLYVIGKLVDIDSRIDNYESSADRPTGAATDFVDSRSDFGPIATSGLSEEELRQIIREEIAHVVAGADTNAATTQNPAEKIVSINPGQIAANTERSGMVAERIDYYRALGAMTNQEFEELQEDIARLAPGDRQQMLNRVSRAINTGEIRTQLR